MQLQLLCLLVFLINSCFSYDLCENISPENDDKSKNIVNILHIAVPGTSSSFFKRKIELCIDQIGKNRLIGRACHFKNCKDKELKQHFCHDQFIYLLKHAHYDFKYAEVYQLSQTLGQKRSYITFLRDPLDYAIKCFHLRSVWDTNWHVLYAENKSDIYHKIFDPYRMNIYFNNQTDDYIIPALSNINMEQWVEYSFWRYNLQTRIFAGDLIDKIEICKQYNMLHIFHANKEVRKVRFNGQCQITFDQAVNMNHQGKKHTLYQQAYDNLTRKFSFVGIFEEMKDSYDLFFYKFGFNQQNIYHANEIKDRSNLRRPLPSTLLKKIVSTRFVTDNLLHQNMLQHLRIEVNNMKNQLNKSEKQITYKEISPYQNSNICGIKCINDDKVT